MKNKTYSVSVENQRVLILMEVVQTSLRDSVLDLDGAFDVLLVRELLSLLHDRHIFFNSWSKIVSKLSLHLTQVLSHGII